MTENQRKRPSPDALVAPGKRLRDAAGDLADGDLDKAAGGEIDANSRTLEDKVTAAKLELG